MKSIILLAAIFSFQISSVFAGKTEVKSSGTSEAETICVECPQLIPIIPLEASYEDLDEVTSLMSEDFLIPEVPMTADFSDISQEIGAGCPDFSPEVPLEADFEATL